ncbi:MAG: hypothetical protein KGS61_17590, partial [Verrucomicrobia bacterium]|nr:hypothetical protein [Verrucomicrobiota bacterium]
MKRRSTLLLLGWLLGAAPTRSEPVLRTVGGATASVSLLRDGDFEQLQQGRPVGWHAAPSGFRVAEGEGRHGSRALACDSPSGEGWFGASQTLMLERTNPAPLMVGGWSRAANVTGGTDRDYSLYVDLVYADGTTLWGQTANFRTGTHDWQERRFMIFPEKPVRTLTIHCLFRNHAGRVWFDDVSVEEVSGGANAVLFQGAAVTLAKARWPVSSLEGHTVSSGDDLRLELESAVAVSSRQTKGRPGGIFHEPDRGLSSTRSGKGLPEGGTTHPSEARDSGRFPLTYPMGEGRGEAPSKPVAGERVRKERRTISGRFLARDVATGSDFFDFTAGRCAELGLELRAQAHAQSNHIVIEGRLTDRTGKDRAITLVFAVPLEAGGWTWGDDLHRHRTIGGRGEFADQVSIHAGATGSEALYPVAPIWSARTGLALALDMGRPAVYRLGYQAGLKVLFIAYDFGLV